MHTTYSRTTSAVIPNRERCRAAAATSSDSVSVTMCSPTSLTRVISWCCRATHQEPEALEVDGAALHLPDDPTVRDDHHPVGQVEDLLELRRDQQHADA